ncbi:hypothetical protein ACFQYP_31055 [Nonomuraea antimicrobica]
MIQPDGGHHGLLVDQAHAPQLAEAFGAVEQVDQHHVVPGGAVRGHGAVAGEAEQAGAVRAGQAQAVGAGAVAVRQVREGERDDAVHDETEGAAMARGQAGAGRAPATGLRPPRAARGAGEKDVHRADGTKPIVQSRPAEAGQPPYAAGR